MKRTDIVFWIFLVAVALFYLFKGNDIHAQRIENVKQLLSQENNNTVRK